MLRCFSWRRALLPSHDSKKTVLARPQLEVLEDRAVPSTFYVSPSGSDSNNGLSQATAWQTIARVNKVTFQPGDSILFQGGATFNGNLLFTSSSSGTAAAPITVSSYGTGSATINAGKSYGLSATNTAGFDIDNLDFVGGSGNTNYGILFRDNLPGSTKLQHVYIDNVDVSGFGKSGIDIGALGATDGYNDVNITHVQSHNNNGVAVYVWGQTPAVSNSNVYIGYTKAYDNGSDGLEIADTNGGTIERSAAHDNGLIAGGCVGIWTYDSNNITIQFNGSWHNHGSAALGDGDGFDFDGGVTNSTMQYNYSHDNDGAGFLLCEYKWSGPTSGNTIRFNISQNDGQMPGYAGIIVSNYDLPTDKVTNNMIYNNTIYNASGGSAVLVDGDLTGAVNVFANNVFQTANGVPLVVDNSPFGATFVGNDYWSTGGPFVFMYNGSTYSSLSAFQSTGQEMLNGQPTGHSIDPQFRSPGGAGVAAKTLVAYKLQPTSGLIGAGLDLYAIYGINPGPRDLFGDPIQPGGPFNIGAD
jgi:hypothetical protein